VRLVAALIEELVVGGRGRKKKKQLCRRERERERKRAAVALGGQQVVGLAAYGGDCDEQVYGGVGRQLEQQRERERKNVQKPRKGLIFGQLCTQFSSFLGHEIHPYL